MAPPTKCNVPRVRDLLECQLAVVSLRLQVFPEVLVVRESLVVLEVVGQSQSRIEAVHLEAPLRSARPLPSSVNPLGIEDTIRGKEEARCKKLEQLLELPVTMPQQDSWGGVRKVHEVQPDAICSEHVFFKRGPVRRPR